MIVDGRGREDPCPSVVASDDQPFCEACEARHVGRADCAPRLPGRPSSTD